MTTPPLAIRSPHSRAPDRSPAMGRGEFSIGHWPLPRLLAVLAFGLLAQAQYSLVWHKVAGGGGTSTGGISGLTRYFKGLVAELSLYNRALSASEITFLYAAGSAGKCQPLPIWAVSLSGGSLLLSWPTNATSFGLFSRTDLMAGAWESVTHEPSLNGDRKEVVLSANTPVQRFFRLGSGN